MVDNPNILNQLAVISDLIEKINLNPISSVLIFEVDEDTFTNLFIHFQNKYNRINSRPEKTFTVKIGSIDVIFNKNNV